MSFTINNRPVGPGHKPYIIAELGVNHDGSPDRAIDLVRLAAHAGADAIKVQIFRAEMLMSRASRLAEYQLAAGESDPVEMLRRLELSWDALEDVLTFAHDWGLAAIATVFSVQLVAPAAALRSRATADNRVPGGFDAWKTASPDIIHRPLLESLAATGRPLIISTGASTLDEVSRAVHWLTPSPACGGVAQEPLRRGGGGTASAVAEQRWSPLALLQCVSSYPTPPELAALEGIPALAGAHPTLPIGYSDHTPGIETGALAVACGACVLEKHFTYDRRAPGPDHAASLEPDAFRQYAEAARAAWESAHRSGYPNFQPAATNTSVAKRLLDIERDVRTVSRQSIVAARDLPAGHRLQPADLTFKRPGTGLEPFRLHEVLNHPLSIPVLADTPLTTAHLTAPLAAVRT